MKKIIWEDVLAFCMAVPIIVLITDLAIWATVELIKHILVMNIFNR